MKVIDSVKKHSKNYKVLIFGHASYLNKGCEALVTTVGRNIKRVNSQNLITVATFDFNNDKKHFNDIVDNYVSHNISVDYSKILNYQSKGNNVQLLLQKEVLKNISKADLCISVGGDNYCYPGQLDFLSTIDEAARSEGKKLILYGASIDEDVLTEDFVADIRKFDIVLVREALTFNLLAPFIDENKLLLAPDPAFSLKTDLTTLPPIFENKEGVVGLNLSPLILKYQGEGVDVFSSIISLVEHILSTYPYSLALIPHVYVKENNDLEILEKIHSLYKSNKRVAILNKKEYSASELKHIISRCRFLIAARTHASIAGYSSLIPTLVLGYSMKSKGIAKDIFGDYSNYVLPVQSLFKSESLINAFDFLIKYEEEIKATLSKKMPKYIADSGKLFEKVINKLEELNRNNITKVEKCSGCAACASSCPRAAIKMTPDKEGFLFPEIKQDLCIDCGHCRKVCPNNKNYKYKYDETLVFAARNSNNNIRMLSSSGGIFSLLSKSVLDEGGCVFGAAYTAKNDVKHIKIEDEKDIDLLRGSKYLESTIGDSYLSAKNELENNRKVLFSGTPCQIEGLKNYLGKNYDNLFCVSVFCHGVPSKLVFKRHLDEMKIIHGEEVESINFRDKDNGWKNYSLVYKFKNKIIRKSIFEDPYMAGFLNDYYLRQSCYDCDYKLGKKNTSDLILGDLWGVEVFDKKIDDNCGLSAVVINSLKGRELINKIENKLFLKKIKINDVIKYNPGLIKTNLINLNRFMFFDLFNKMGIDFAVKYFLNIDEIKKLKAEINLSTSVLEEKEQQIQDALNNIAVKEGIIKEILNSKRWKIMEFIVNFIRLPISLKKEYILRKLFFKGGK